jgi:hypothetical protein
MVWSVGQSGNPTGRPKGSRNKRTEELFLKLKERGDLDPAEFLSSIVTDNNEPKEYRIQAAANLLPYKYSKMGTTPIRPDPIFMRVLQKNPRPATITQCLENIAFLSEGKASGKIDVESADSLIADNRVILAGLIDEAKLLAQAPDPNAEQRILIQGGLPALPGTEIIMPKMNGHEQPAITHVSGPSPGPTDYNAGSPPTEPEP